MGVLLISFSKVHLKFSHDKRCAVAPILTSVGLRASQVTLVVKNLPDNAGDTRDLDLITGSSRFLGVGNGNPLQYPCLGNYMDRGAWRATSMRSQRVDMTEYTHAGS